MSKISASILFCFVFLVWVQTWQCYLLHSAHRTMQCWGLKLDFLHVEQALQPFKPSLTWAAFFTFCFWNFSFGKLSFGSWGKGILGAVSGTPTVLRAYSGFCAHIPGGAGEPYVVHLYARQAPYSLSHLWLQKALLKKGEPRNNYADIIISDILLIFQDRSKNSSVSTSELYMSPI